MIFCFFIAIFQNSQTAAHTYLNNFESPSIPANSLGRHSGKKPNGRRIGADTAHTEVETPRPYVARRTDSPSVLSPHRTSAPRFETPRDRVRCAPARAPFHRSTQLCVEVRPESSPRAPDRRADPRASSLPIQAKRATVWVTRDDRPDQPRRRCARTPNPPPRAPEPRPHPPAASPRLS